MCRVCSFQANQKSQQYLLRGYQGIVFLMSRLKCHRAEILVRAIAPHLALPLGVLPQAIPNSIQTFSHFSLLVAIALRQTQVRRDLISQG